MYNYFVSFSHPKGFGATSLKQNVPVRSMEIVTKMKEVIERENHLTGVVILNWQRFESD